MERADFVIFRAALSAVEFLSSELTFAVPKKLVSYQKQSDTLEDVLEIELDFYCGIFLFKNKCVRAMIEFIAEGTSSRFN